MTEVLQVDSISKKYILGKKKQESYLTIRDTLVNNLKNIFSKRENKSNNLREFWALKDISFSVFDGDKIGIIGKNGAGKSTLLKILSQITEPTEGTVKVKGKISSLLEVGTGFHPELTGRENIFLNGSILGMTRTEIKNKFDEIVNFADVEQFLDTPVKRYSSGMYVRLAFSVAAHLDPEILLIDEVLAVGDTQFQKKCLEKMDKVSKEGRTVIFVSHNLALVKKLCTKGILIESGILKKYDHIDNVINEYLSENKGSPAIIDLSELGNDYGNNEINVLSIELLNPFQSFFAIKWNEPIKLRIKFKANTKIKDLSCAIGLMTPENIPLFTVRNTDNVDSMEVKEEGIYEITTEINHNIRAGIYALNFGLYSENYVYYYKSEVCQIEIMNVGNREYLDKNYGLINCEANWDYK